MAFSYDLSVFSTLRKTYPTWEGFQAYMQSEEGGGFRIVEEHSSGLCLFRYEKGTSSMMLPHAPWCRSILWDRNTHLPVSIAPPKACGEAIPYATIGDATEAGAVCQEMIDGWMIQAFRRAGDPTLYLTSRSYLHATGTFYSPRSFRELFLESYLGTTGTMQMMEEMLQADPFFESPCVEKGETAVFYSFLVQHKDHRVVSPIKENRALLIHKGVVHASGQVTIVDDPHSVMGLSQGVACMDPTTSFASWNTTHLASLLWDNQGIVWKDRTGRRWRYRSPAYELIRSLRGNHASAVDRYAQLYTQNLTHTYLQYFFEDSVPFSFFRALLQRISKEIFQAYMDVHVYRNITRDKVLSIYHPHLYQLHHIYRTQLRPMDGRMNSVALQKYLYSLPWQRVSFLLRQHPLWNSQ
jgi:hypothetical protein